MDSGSGGIHPHRAPRWTECRWKRPATGPGPMLDEDGELLAVYEADRADRIRPAVVVASA